MKKSLLALAVFGAFAGSALAQSSVTLYGRADFALVRDDPKPSTCVVTATSSSNPCATRTAIDSGYYAGSRLGFRGSEDIGGANAIFQLEAGYNIDSGTSGQGGRLFGRQAFVGVQGYLGTIVAGRIAAPSSGTGTFDVWGGVDPFITGYGIAGIQSTFSSSGSLRADNSVLYRSPIWGGFQFLIHHSAAAGISAPASEAPGGGDRNQSLWSFAVALNSGPFYGAVTYDRINRVTPFGAATDLPTQTHLQIGAKVDLGGVSVHGGFANEKAQYTFSSVGAGSALSVALFDPATSAASTRTAAQTTGADGRSYFVGLTVSLGQGNFIGSYQMHNGKPLTVGTVVTELDRSVWAIGYAYPLSKRTQVHAVFANSNGSKQLNNNPTYDTRQLAAGFSHAF